MNALLAATTQPNPLWFVARATGVVALLLFTAAVALGVVTTGRWSTPVWPRSLLAGVHRNISLLSVVFLAVHIAASVLDPFAHIRWSDVVLPFTGSYRPVWLGLGVVAIELALAVIVSSLLRLVIGLRAWRAIHWTAYVLWPLALVHGLGTGSDSRQWWALALDAGCTATVLAAVLHRLGVARSALVRRRAILGVAAVAMVVLGVWAYNGPLQQDWARRAGTPVAVGPVVTAPPVVKPTPLADPASAQVVGSGQSTSLVFVDSRDPSIAVTVTPSTDGASRVLTLEQYAQTVCSGAATVTATNVTASCGGNPVTLTLTKSADGELSGTIRTGKPLS